MGVMRCAFQTVGRLSISIGMICRGVERDRVSSLQNRLWKPPEDLPELSRISWGLTSLPDRHSALLSVSPKV